MAWADRNLALAEMFRDIVVYDGPVERAANHAGAISYKQGESQG